MVVMGKFINFLKFVTSQLLRYFIYLISIQCYYSVTNIAQPAFQKWFINQGCRKVVNSGGLISQQEKISRVKI